MLLVLTTVVTMSGWIIHTLPKPLFLCVSEYGICFVLFTTIVYIKLIIDIRIFSVERPFLGTLFLYRLLVLTLYI